MEFSWEGREALGGDGFLCVNRRSLFSRKKVEFWFGSLKMQPLPLPDCSFGPGVSSDVYTSSGQGLPVMSSALSACFRLEGSSVSSSGSSSPPRTPRPPSVRLLARTSRSCGGCCSRSRFCSWLFGLWKFGGSFSYQDSSSLSRRELLSPVLLPESFVALSAGIAPGHFLPDR